MTALEVTADKRFGDCVAVAGASMAVEVGTIHALVGENGAGKSTLLKIAFGLIRADRGSLAIGGAAIELAHHSPRQARARGLGLVQQHGALVASLTVVENAVLGREGGWPLVDLAGPAAALEQVGREVGLAIDPRARVADLPVGVAQRAEILMALEAGATILALDEPTALLTPAEVASLFAALRRLRDAGKTVILVTHKLDEVRAIADRVTVLRAGKTVATFAGDAPSAEIAHAMIGADVPVVMISAAARGASPGPRAAQGADRSARPSASALPLFAAASAAIAARGPHALELTGVRAASRSGSIAIESLVVRAGEIVGVAGVEGNGQRELIAAVAGMIRARGRVAIGGREVASSVAARRAAGLSLIPEDRQLEGLVLEASVAENLALGRLADVSPGIQIDRAKLRAYAVRLCADFDIRPADPDAMAGALSGGNQQKVVVARELSREGVTIVIAAQPTRGVDVAAIALIHARLRAAAEAGAGVLLVSADLDEILALAHRAIVLYRGAVAGSVDAVDAAERTRLGALMTGVAS